MIRLSMDYQLHSGFHPYHRRLSSRQRSLLSYHRLLVCYQVSLKHSRLPTGG